MSPIGILWWWWRIIWWWHIRSWSSIRLELNSQSLSLSFHQFQYYFWMFVAYLLLGLKLGLLRTISIINNYICCWLHAWLHWGCDNYTGSRIIFNFLGFEIFTFESILNRWKILLVNLYLWKSTNREYVGNMLIQNPEKITGFWEYCGASFVDKKLHFWSTFKLLENSLLVQSERWKWTKVGL